MIIYQLKDDENGQLIGVDTSKLLVANSGNDLAVRKRNGFIQILKNVYSYGEYVFR